MAAGVEVVGAIVTAGRVPVVDAAEPFEPEREPELPHALNATLTTTVLMTEGRSRDVRMSYAGSIRQTFPERSHT